MKRTIKVYAGKPAAKPQANTRFAQPFSPNANVKQRLRKLYRLHCKGLLEQQMPDLTNWEGQHYWRDKPTPASFGNVEHYLATKRPNLPDLIQTKVAINRRKRPHDQT